jgi:outer membrane lipoprotein-sorting protein
MNRCRSLVLLLAAVVGWYPCAASKTTGADDPSEQALFRWLEQQSKISSWTADVVQTRKLRSLVRPLSSSGEVWFVQPSRFRWQLGDPPRTIAVRAHDELLVIYPRLKQAERYAAGKDVEESWQQALDLLEVGFPSDAEAFLSRYELLGGELLERGWRFELRPAARSARRLLERVRLEVSESDLQLLATELVFPDGSTMRNEFSNHRINPDLDESLFSIEIPDDYEIVTPLENR